jgi:hypothetical protein
MASRLKLFMVLVGCRPTGRLTEQHDIFFGIGKDLKDLVPAMNEFWPDSNGLHIDAWREVTSVDGFMISIEKRTSSTPRSEQLFFINLGGYKKDEFEEYHYKVLAVTNDLSAATLNSKKTAFYKHADLKVPGGASHIDDKYGIDIDDIVKVADVLPKNLRQLYTIVIEPGATHEDDLHIGYLKFSKIK